MRRNQLIQHHTLWYDHLENVYYNAEIHNPKDNTTDIKSRYSETRNQPIISGKASDYVLSVERFQIPFSDIPIFEFKDNTYSVSLSFGGNDEQTFLIYQNRDVNPNARAIFEYQHFLDIINTGFTTCFNDFVTAHGAFPSATQAPYITYDSVTKLFTLHVEKAYEADGIQVFMNWPLYTFFQSWEINFNSYGTSPFGEDIEILIKDNNNNTDPLDATLYIFPQQLSALYLWFDIQKIVFLTRQIPVQKEYISDREETGINKFTTRLIDYTPLINGLERPSELTFFLQGPRRLIDLKGDDDIRNLDFEVYWEDKEGRLREIFLNPNDTLSIKLLFMRK